MPRKLIELRFNTAYGPYNSGELVGFEPDRANQLLDLTATVRISETESGRGPLVTKVREVIVEGRTILSEKKFGLFAEKVMVTKGEPASAESPKTLEPVPEPVPEPLEEEDSKPRWGKKKHR